MPFDDVALHKGGVARLQLRDDPVGGFYCVQVIANHISDGKTSSAEVALLGGAVVAAGGAMHHDFGVGLCLRTGRSNQKHQQSAEQIAGHAQEQGLQRSHAAAWGVKMLM